MTPSRLLRGRAAEPFTFGALDGAPPDGVADAPAAFVPFAALGEAEPLGDDAGAAGPEPFVPFDAPAPGPPPRPARDPDQAFEEGRQAALAEQQATADALQAEVERLEAALEACKAASEKRTAFAERTADRLHKAWHRACDELQRPLASLALEAAEAVLEAPLSAEQRAATEASLSAALDSIAETAPLTIALHPVDLLHLQETGLATALEATHSGLRWTSDTSLDEGDWTVASSEGAVRRVRTDMLAALRGRLHLDN